MVKFQRLSLLINDLVTVPSYDPDDARRRKLLNILLAGVIALSILTIVILFLVDWLNLIQPDFRNLILVASLTLSVGSLTFYGLNRRQDVPGWVSSGLFLLMMMGIIALADTPQEVADGRTLFAFAIPIIMSSVLLKPFFSFVFSALCSLEIAIIALLIDIQPNTFAMVGFFLIAFVAWLSAITLEQALYELRRINADLDRVVAERTKALAESLTREKIEAGRSKAVLESIADGVLVFDTLGNALQANPSSGLLLGMPIDALEGSSIKELLRSPLLAPRHRYLFEGILTSTVTQLTSPRIEWGQKTLSVSSAPVRGPEGNVYGTVAVFRDFTREAEVEKMKNTFVAIVSHELRTPLNAILGYAEMLKEAVYGSINQKQVGVLDRLMNNTQRLLYIVNDLLDQAQIESGRLTIQSHPLRPVELLDNVRSISDPIAREKGLKIAYEIEPCLPAQLMGDGPRLQQILVNLVSNAVKFTDTGSVQVRMFCPENDRWAMEVLDTGQGIPAESISQIFDSFKQVEGSETREHRGIGLGLSIVKQLVQLMGGSIEVKSQIGVGSIFTVVLPLVTTEKEK